MKYGYFDGPNKEYVVTRPDTPKAWCNYLGSPAYGAIISNNAAGYSFVKSGASGRLMRFRFNSVPEDEQGRFIYIYDKETKDYWSGSWQPVGKPLDSYKSECRHGTGYTVISSEYAGIRTETLYYVPMTGLYEVWNCKVTNVSDKPRKLSLTGVVEFTNESNYEQDQVNLQYTLFISRTYFENNSIIQAINENTLQPGETKRGVFRYFGAAGMKADSYDGDLKKFLGKYRTYRNPQGIEQGKLSNSLNYNLNSVGALEFDLELQPGESKVVNFVFGEGDREVAESVRSQYEEPFGHERVTKEIAEIKEYWHSRINRLQVRTPDENFNNMMNCWSAYQSFITFNWSRSASLIYCGLRNGLGYRDTVQDIQGAVYLDPEMARERLELMFTGLVNHGGALPLIRWEFEAGKEGTPEDPEYVRLTGAPEYRADDALWLFPTTDTYINETGDVDFLKKVLLYSNEGEGTVYEHLKRAIGFNLAHSGAHGLPAGLSADWNDCLQMGSKGESSFVALQLYYAVQILEKYAGYLGIDEDIKWCEELKKTIYDSIQGCMWDEDRFVRGICEDGLVIGAKDAKEASLWLNPQTWGVISGLATEEQAEKSMDKVYEVLNSKYGAKLFDPPFTDFGLPTVRMILFNPGTKENAGIFSQPQGWLVNAECVLGHGNRAFEYFTEISPATANDNYADIRELEPYAHGQSVEGPDSPNFGRAHVHWLTGTASTVIVAMTQGILGIKPELEGIVIEPCIPKEWDGLTIDRTWRGKLLRCTVDNSAHVEKGIVKAIVNGEEIEGKCIPEAILKEENDITLVMG